MLTAEGPGAVPGGGARAALSPAHMKQCVAPVSSITATRRGPEGVHMEPATTGLKSGARRRHGV